MKKILIVTSSLGPGGTERVVSTLGNAWCKMGRRVTILTTFSGGGSDFFPLVDGIARIRLADSVGPLGRSLRGRILRFLALRNVILATKPNVVVAFLDQLAVLTILASLGTSIPVIACERTNPYSYSIGGPIWKLLRRITYPLAAFVTLQTTDMARRFAASNSRMRVVSIPNPLPVEIFNYFGKKLPAPISGKPKIIAVGRLSHEKGFDLLISAFSQIASSFSQWELWIWGDGPDRPLLENAIIDAGVVGRVFLPGKTDKPWEAMNTGEIFVLPSRIEGMPNALLEAMALGLPCIAFDCLSGPRELSNNGDLAMIVSPESVPELANALTYLISKPQARMILGKKAEQVRERFHLETVLLKWEALFEKCRVLRSTQFFGDNPGN